MNKSKARDPRFWRRWYASGAVSQKQFPDDELVIDSIGHILDGPRKGCVTLSLGSKIIDSGSGWQVRGSVCAVVVPSDPKYKLGVRLDKIPNNAVPVELAFP